MAPYGENIVVIETMKRLLLVSNGLEALPEFIGKPGAKVVFIPTAADLDKDKWYVERDRKFLKEKGFTLIELQINTELSAQAIAALKAADVLYVAGGNTFYLLKAFMGSGLSKMLPGLLEGGLRYVGASAGAAVLGPSLLPLQKLDDPSAVDLPSMDGLGLIGFVPLPHYAKNNPVYQEVLDEFGQTFRLVPFTDDQAVRVSGSTWQIVTSAQSA